MPPEQHQGWEQRLHFDTGFAGLVAQLVAIAVAAGGAEEEEAAAPHVPQNALRLLHVGIDLTHRACNVQTKWSNSIGCS